MPTEKRPVQYALTRRPLVGGMPLVGSNSLPSIVRAVKKSDNASHSRREPAQMMESPSSVDRKEQTPSTVHTTDGDTPKTQSQPSARPAKKAAKKAAAKKAQPNVRVVDELADDEDDDF